METVEDGEVLAETEEEGLGLVEMAGMGWEEEGVEDWDLEAQEEGLG